MFLKPGQRWKRVGFDFDQLDTDGTKKKILMIEIISITDASHAEARVVQTKDVAGYPLGRIAPCGGFPREADANDFWMYLPGQDAPSC
jgi:hypothetical protein